MFWCLAVSWGEKGKEVHPYLRSFLSLPGSLPSSNQSVPKAVPTAGKAGEPGGAPGQRESEPGAQPLSSSTAWRLWGGGRRAECHGHEMEGKGGVDGRTLGEVRGEEAAGGEGKQEMQAWGGFTKSCASHFRISASHIREKFKSEFTRALSL